MSETTIIRYGLGVILAVALSNGITLAIYFAGYPMLALGVSAPTGLIIGSSIGLWIHWKQQQ